MTDEFVDIVFDGPPGPEAGRFVEVENPQGAGIGFGEWMQRQDGYWVLRIPDGERLTARLTIAQKAFDDFSKAFSTLPGSVQVAVQTHDPTWEAWKALCHAVAAHRKHG